MYNKQAMKPTSKEMTSLNYEQWHEWSTQMQNEHSKLTNTECCVCYDYQVLNKSVCGECNYYVCEECSNKLEHNECPMCRTSGIVKGRPVEPREEFNINHTIRVQPSTIRENIVEFVSFLYNDYMEFDRNYRTNHTINTFNTNRVYPYREFPINSLGFQDISNNEFLRQSQTLRNQSLNRMDSESRDCRSHPHQGHPRQSPQYRPPSVRQSYPQNPQRSNSSGFRAPPHRSQNRR